MTAGALSARLAALCRSGPSAPARVPLLLLGMVALVTAIGAGLARVGWEVPDAMARQAGIHGPLMIGAFFTTVIGLERAVALGRGWAYLAPLAAALGGLALIAGLPLVVGQGALLAGAAILLLAGWHAHGIQPSSHARVMLLGAACGTVASALWLVGVAVPAVVPWWLAFLVLTIAGERLELSRFVPTPPVARRTFAGLVGVLLAALALSLVAPDPGGRLFGAALLALALWLVRYDIARRTVGSRGLTRYIAVCLLSGYFWLALSGLGALAGGLWPGQAAHDATLHALGLGFVFAMVFGHAAVIFPAVLPIRIHYSPLFYGALVLLQLVLLLRVAGDLLAWRAVQALAAAGSGAAIGVFFLTMLFAMRAGRRRVE